MKTCPYIFFVVLLCTKLVSAQDDPVRRLSVDRIETRNFEIFVQRSDKTSRPTAKEVGVLVERLCAQLDKIFEKYSPQRIAEEQERLENAENEIGRNKTKTAGTDSVQKKKKGVKAGQDAAPIDPDRIIPKCKIFIFNDRESYTAKCLFDGIDEDSEILHEGYAGFFTLKTNSIYMIRSWSVQETRKTLLHETTHYYMFNFLPGGWFCYPQWFHEGLARSYESHVWTGNKLTVGTQPRLQKFDAPASALIGLKRFQHYLKNEAVKNNPSGITLPEIERKPETERRKKGKATEPETPIDPDLIQVFLDKEFSRETLLRDGVTLKGPHEEIAHRYAMYLALGRYLLADRPEHMGAIMRQISFWENRKDRTFPKQNWFNEAWKIAAAEKPITVEEVGRWLRKNQLPFQWTYGDWQDLGDQIAGKGEDDKISILALRDPQAVPRFTVYPKNSAKFQVGVVINYIDNNNFGAVVVDQDGDVLEMQQLNGSWIGAKRIGKIGPLPARNGPYGNNMSFQFSVARQAGIIAVQINKQSAGTWPNLPKSCCGFFLSSTEAIFSY